MKFMHAMGSERNVKIVQTPPISRATRRITFPMNRSFPSFYLAVVKPSIVIIECLIINNFQQFYYCIFHSNAAILALFVVNVYVCRTAAYTDVTRAVPLIYSS